MNMRRLINLMEHAERLDELTGIKNLGLDQFNKVEDDAFDMITKNNDGVIFHNVCDIPGADGSLRAYETDAYVAFFPKQIKSAIGNKGNFDPDSHNITENS